MLRLFVILLLGAEVSQNSNRRFHAASGGSSEAIHQAARGSRIVEHLLLVLVDPARQATSIGFITFTGED